MASVAGCSQIGMLADIDGRADTAAGQIDRHRSAFTAQVVHAPNERMLAQDVDRPWLAGRPQPLAREVTLPEALRASVETSLMFPGGRVDLLTLGEQISLATGIQVRVQPDALLPMEDFLPRLASSGTLAAGLPANVSLPTGMHPLPRVLDMVANRLGVYWKYEQGSIHIFRTETRTFNVRALTLKSSAAASLGRSGNASGGAFESASATKIETTGGDAIAAVKAKLEPFLTRAGVLAANADSSGLLVVTDTRDALDRIGVYLERENKALTRRVRLLFEEVELISKNNNEQSIDWNVVYAKSRAALRMASPATLVSDVAGNALTASASGGRLDGSAVILNALSEIGTVVRRTTVPLQTLNRRPVTHAVRTTFSYIDQVQVTTVASSAGTSTAPSVTQKEETVGTFLTVIPDAQDDGQVLLSIAYDNTIAQPLKTLTFGTNGNQVQLQQKTIDGMGTVQQVELRPGQPVVISGFERAQDQYDKRRLDEKIPMLFGGSGKASSDRTTTVVIVTAQIEEGF
jgi:type IVB pilus formation R64 PilN family outer membrane protein